MRWALQVGNVVVISAVTLLMVATSNAALVMWGPSPNGNHTSLVVDGVRRDYLLHVPADLPDQPVPLVLVLHGAYGWGDQIARATDFSQKADLEGFIVAYPEGQSTIPRLWQFWNATYCCYGAEGSGHQDVAFLDALIDHLLATRPIDPTRVYLVGFSNGGMLASQYVADHPERIAALVTASSTIGAGLNGAQPERVAMPAIPVPVFVLHGLRDSGVPWDGRPSHRESAWRPVSGDEAVAFWRSANHNDASPVEETWANGNIHVTTWGAGSAGEVKLLLVENAGHSWPGGDGAPFFSKPTRDADATALAWEFLQSHTR